MFSTSKLKSVDFYRKIPRDLTEASLSGAGLSIIAALAMLFLFGMELGDYLTISTTTSVVVDRSPDTEFLRIDFNLSFPALSCEFASVDVNDALGTNRLNITKTVRKFSIDKNLIVTGSEYHSGQIPKIDKIGDFSEEELPEGSVALTGASFDTFTHQYPILVVNFYAPWCYWSNRLKPSWEKAAQIMKERYDPEIDGRILLGKVDCTVHVDLCRRNHIQGYPSIRIFRKGSDIKDNHGHHDHESYYGDRDTDSLLAAMEALVAPIKKEETLSLEDKSNKTVQIDESKRPAPKTSGCRIEGFVRVKKVPGNLVISARSGSHSFDPKQINVSHFISQFSFGKKLSPRMYTEIKRLTPYTGDGHDRLAGKSYITHSGDSNADVTLFARAELGDETGDAYLLRVHSVDPKQISVSHFISQFSFGKKLSPKMYTGDGYDRLAGKSYITHSGDSNADVTIEHYLQLVKTEVVTRRASREFKILEEYEYTSHSSLVHSTHIPVAKFHFEPSAMQVLVTEVPKSFSHFITNVCAIIGGIFTVAGILDSILHNTMRMIKKVELGKNF